MRVVLSCIPREREMYTEIGRETDLHAQLTDVISLRVTSQNKDISL